MSQTLLNQVQQIVSDIFNVPMEQVTVESSPDTIESWDSLKHIELVMALEQHMGIEIMPEEIAEMGKIEDIIRIVNKKLS